MTNLLSANLFRLRKSILFWVTLLLCAAAGAWQPLQTYLEYQRKFPLDAIFFVYAMLIGLVLSVFLPLFFGSEYSDGTIRNKLAAGLLGGPKAPGPLLTSLILSLLMAAAWCAIFTLVIMNFSRKAASAVCCMLLFLLIFGTALTVYQVLDAPEFYPSLQLVDGEMVSEMVRNPRYLQPDERKIYELLLDLDPVGQAVQFTDGTVTRPVQMALCSMGIFAVTTAAGLALFQRKDLK